MNGWTFLLFCFLVKSLEINGDGDGCKDKGPKPLMLNGHYVKWPSKKMSSNFIRKNQYIPKNIIYTRFQLYGDNVFLAAPRYKQGVPFTLGKTHLKSNKEMQQSFDTDVKPFPCLDQKDKGNGLCAAGTLVNVVDLVMGVDGILWVLDIGVSNTLDDIPSRDEDPKIVGFDVATGNIKHSISLRTLNCKTESQYQYLLVERTKSNKTMLYVADSHTRSIIVWDVATNTGNRIKLQQFVIKGCKETPQNDIFQIALVKQNDKNYIYFTFMSNQNIFRILTTNMLRIKRLHAKYIVNIGKKPKKMVFLGVGYDSILYFRFLDQTDLYSFDTKLDLIEENFIMVRKSRDCRIITHMDVDHEGTLWIIESNIQDFISDNTGCYGPNILLMAVTKRSGTGNDS